MARPASDISPRIVHAARERFLMQGVDGASLRDIAKGAGTNIGMVYYYFKTKDELFLAVVEEVYAGFVADLTLALSDSAVPAEQRVRRIYARLAAMNEIEFQVLRLILREALVSSERLQKLVARFSHGHLPLVASLLAEGIADGSFRADRNPLAMFAATFSMAVMPQIAHRMISASQLPIAQHLPSPQEAAGALGDVLLFGIAGPKLKPGAG